MSFLYAFFFICLLLLVARLLELQVFSSNEYRAAAQRLHLDGIRLPAQRGEIFALNSKTGETAILATNTTLDLVYVDPLVTDNPTLIAETLSDILLTPQFHDACTKGEESCPRELINFYAPAFDPLSLARKIASGALLEPISSLQNNLPSSSLSLPDLTEARRLFARDIESRISSKRVTFVPLKYSATKIQMAAVRDAAVPGVYINEAQKLIYANPEEIPQTASRIRSFAERLAPILEADVNDLEGSFYSRPLRYVAVMRKIPPEMSLKIKEKKLESMKETNKRRSEVLQQTNNRAAADKVVDPLRGIALISEHWRFYPDDTIASQVVGFLNTNQEAQYGIERAFEANLRGQEGRITTVTDLQGGQILTSDQTIIDPKDGDSLVLTIDPFIQKGVEDIMDRAVKTFGADSGQAVIMDPNTGHILAMVNAPLFERNAYGNVYKKVPLNLAQDKLAQIVVEIYDPRTNDLIVRDFVKNVLTPEGRALQSETIRKHLDDVETLYDLKDLARYYLYLGEHSRREVFPTAMDNVWLGFENMIGVGALQNLIIQAQYEPGSVMKPVTMAIAMDQGEVIPTDTYDDFEDVKVDEYTIRNALLINYGTVTMTNCLEFSINTCMTSVSAKLGRKLFQHELERFGFGRITGIELGEDELSGEVPPWRKWSDSLLATASFGQGMTVTPLQMVTSYAPLANGGKLLKPKIIDRIIHPDGTVEIKEDVTMVDQVIKPETSRDITQMLVSSVEHGYAKSARVPGYSIAGKTGTSQIAGPGGRYERGTGSTIASFAGYAPAEAPRFLALVKFDRPRVRSDAGASTAAPTFKEIAQFLFSYYGIPPRK